MSKMSSTEFFGKIISKYLEANDIANFDGRINNVGSMGGTPIDVVMKYGEEWGYCADIVIAGTDHSMIPHKCEEHWMIIARFPEWGISVKNRRGFEKSIY